MKAIIFGITGQDGSHLAELLLSKGYQVVGVSRRVSVDNTQRLRHLTKEDGFELVSGDITDTHSVNNILSRNGKVEEVYNLAAQSHVAVSFKQPGLTWDITGKGCLNILQSLVDLGMTNTRFYQASSSEMFGKSYNYVGYNHENEDGNNTFRHTKCQNEDTKFLPQSPYAIAKCAAHYMTRLYREGYGLHASAGILFNHEGPRRGETFVTRKITKWIGEFVNFREGRNLVELIPDDDFIVNKSNSFKFPKLRLGNLEAFRDWGYAGDYVEAMWMMLQQDSPDDYVICTGETHTIREFLDVAFSYVGIDDWSNFVVQDPEFYRPAEVDYLRGQNNKARERLGWIPKYSFKDLVTLMVDHDIKNIE
tara:strand:- start:15690 stop:16781 length:1092 start_codon:yes stop_codon:yes gene_type:complete